MFIQTEETPNPAALKFLPGRPVLESGVADFTSRDAAARSPLARLLFEIDGVAGVFLGSDFVTVSKTGEKNWQVLKPMVLGAIMDHFTANAPVMDAGADGATDLGADDQEFNDDDVDGEIIEQIKELIETRVRPAVAQDGGDIVYKGFKNGTVYLNLRGSCAGCPSSSATLKMGIENMLKHYVPEVLQVEAVM
jgi:Fe-S cluster biogenesis protein NfuA